MRANKIRMWVGIAVVAILFCIVLANMRYITPPRLVIRFDGKPLRNVTLVLPDGSDSPYQLDDEGSITARDIGWRETSILVPVPDGGGVSVGFPKHGTKVIDFQGRVTTTTVVQYSGLVLEKFESFKLTDGEMADIESGRTTLRPESGNKFGRTYLPTDPKASAADELSLPLGYTTDMNRHMTFSC